MDKQEIIDGLDRLKERLLSDVYTSFNDRGANYGARRFVKWKHVTTAFLEENMPREVKHFNALFVVYAVLLRRTESDADYFWITDGEKTYSYLDSLILDIQNDEYDFTPINKEVKQVEATPKEKSKNVFIVHGHNNEVKERTARFIQKLGFEPIILHEQASGGSTTIIEKILEYAKTTDFAIVLYTADDVGGIKNTEPSDLKPRARQNVVFEHGLLIGLLGRENVVPLVADNIEIPNDISGVVYVRNDWQTAIAKEMKKAGYEIDFNKLF
ncbi:nucleotide-binding protein [Shewanella sp. SP1S2-4]|uniref:nucleotide-binding protein n=1 Tax=Shewanella sp. SP1S2-4 TaxID=3063537 RepID=UPI00289175D3|nr:nucleotide-binding protein [Shewanella sp. SP1S2-4]MDT3321175.1 nucleotide-binding protein [Shewanella sp. SP1S2-4]